MIINIVLESC